MEEYLTPFSAVIKPIEVSGIKGKLLLICGCKYKAWDTDTFIYEAIQIASKWKTEEVTFDRIVLLRNWIRENYQHGHNIDSSFIQNLADTKQFVMAIINEEYEFQEVGLFKQIDVDRLNSIFP